MDNHVSVVGRVARTPTFYNEDTPRLKFNFVIHREWTSKKTGLANSRDSYYDIVCFGNLALGCKELELDDDVIVIGKLNQRTVVGDDGTKHSILEIAADHVGMSLAA